MKYALVFGLGLFLLAGAAGSQDFYDECRAAADCVAGDPPSMFLTVVQCILGVAAMVVGVVGMNKEIR